MKSKIKRNREEKFSEEDSKLPLVTNQHWNDEG